MSVRVDLQNKISFLPLKQAQDTKQKSFLNSEPQPQPFKKADSELLKAYFAFSSNKNNTSIKSKDIIPENSEYIDQLKKRNPTLFLKEVVDNFNKENGRGKSASPKQIRDFLDTVSELKINDKENLILLSKIASNLFGYATLKQSNRIQNDWLKRTLNDPYLPRKLSSDNLKDYKKELIINSCRPTDSTGNIIKNGTLFLNTTKSGDIPEEENRPNPNEDLSPLGLFRDDTQFLSDYKLSIEGEAEKSLILEKSKSGISISDYKIKSQSGLDINREQVLNKGLFERIRINNNSQESKTLKIDFESNVKDIFEARGWTPLKKEHDIEVIDDAVYIWTKSTDERQLGIKIQVKVDGTPVYIADPANIKDGPKVDILNSKGASICAKIPVPAGVQGKTAEVSIIPYLKEEIGSKSIKTPIIDNKLKDELDIPSNFKEAKDSIPKKSLVLEVSGFNGADKALQQSLDDIEFLINVDKKTGLRYVAAGVPKYATLFGRDALTTSLEMLPLKPGLAKETILLLGEYQGKSMEDRIAEEFRKLPSYLSPNLKDEYKKAAEEYIKKRYIKKDEQEGKILHENRVGELAKQDLIEHNPFYGTIDATPLWLKLITDYYKWTGDDDIVKDLMPKIDKAVDWINRNLNENGFLIFKGAEKEYGKPTLAMHVWKDSDESPAHIIGPDGKITLPEFPLAFAEVQGYVYDAKIGLSELLKELSEKETRPKKKQELENKSSDLKEQAQKLKKNFNEKFWMEDENFIAMALDAKGRAIPSITSNGAQCLATGIIDDPVKINQMEKRIMSRDDLNSGWGIRTLSKKNPVKVLRLKDNDKKTYIYEKFNPEKGSSADKSPAYNEMSYHNGSVWPHDTALIARGLSHENSAVLAKNLIEVANSFDGRIPELIAGFDRKEGDNKIQLYPGACSPQAWSAASIPDILITSIGLKPDKNGVKLENPVLPEGLDRISLKNLNIRDKSLNLSILKTEKGLEIKATSKDKNINPKKNGNNYHIEIPE